jgi:hypothetical protein
MIEALDALAVALAGHGHVWTETERALYERAVMVSSCRMGSGSLASTTRLHQMPYREQNPPSDRA